MINNLNKFSWKIFIEVCLFSVFSLKYGLIQFNGPIGAHQVLFQLSDQVAHEDSGNGAYNGSLSETVCSNLI